MHAIIYLCAFTFDLNDIACVRACVPLGCIYLPVQIVDKCVHLAATHAAKRSVKSTWFCTKRESELFRLKLRYKTKRREHRLIRTVTLHEMRTRTSNAALSQHAGGKPI